MDERLIKFTPAYDKRSSDPAKNYGIHGVEIRFLLKKEKATMQFVIYTNWQLPYVQKEINKDALRKDIYFIEALLNPMGADVGCHSKQPMYEGQEAQTENCEFTGGVCYYDGSSLQATDLLNKFIAEGEDIIWETLEDRYQNWIEGKE